MLFSNNIPEAIFENPEAVKFISVLDSLQEYKQGIIDSFIRSTNPALCTDSKWLRKYLYELGFSEIPKNFPIEIMQQMLLNANSIMALRGSKLGVEFFISTCTLGEVTITEYTIHEDNTDLYLDSPNYGYITGSKEEGIKDLFIVGNTMGVTPTKLSVTVKSRYFNGQYTDEANSIVGYLERVMPKYVGFSENLAFTIKRETRSDFYYHELLNKQFIN